MNFAANMFTFEKNNSIRPVDQLDYVPYFFLKNTSHSNIPNMYLYSTYLLFFYYSQILVSIYRGKQKQCFFYIRLAF